MGVYQKLANVQRVLKCSKSKYNSFGKYKYRSCEDILEAAKPLCIEQGLVLLVSDDIALIGERYYVKSEAKVVDVENGETVSNVAYAREEENKKGQDAPQTTGTTSSYARKYALNGLFCLDDTQDADTEEYHNETATRAESAEPKAWVKKEKGKVYVLANNGSYYDINDLPLDQLNKLSNDKRFTEAGKEIRDLMAKKHNG